MTTTDSEGTAADFPSHSDRSREAPCAQHHAAVTDGPLLTAHAMLVLVAAAFIGAIVGVLAFLSTGNLAGSLLAGIGGFGASAPVLHKLIGP